MGCLVAVQCWRLLIDLSSSSDLPVTVPCVITRRSESILSSFYLGVVPSKKPVLATTPESDIRYFVPAFVLGRRGCASVLGAPLAHDHLGQTRLPQTLSKRKPTCHTSNWPRPPIEPSSPRVAKLCRHQNVSPRPASFK
ncbi:hypothetical protein BS17DRAFT_787661 [Gyrodon lividus]|nr:hypothetical protein BS17DRAFT_787661 [Gyrodon lividus]